MMNDSFPASKANEIAKEAALSRVLGQIRTAAHQGLFEVQVDLGDTGVGSVLLDLGYMLTLAEINNATVNWRHRLDK